MDVGHFRGAHAFRQKDGTPAKRIDSGTEERIKKLYRTCHIKDVKIAEPRDGVAHAILVFPKMIDCLTAMVRKLPRLTWSCHAPRVELALEATIEGSLNEYNVLRVCDLKLKSWHAWFTGT